MVDADVIIVGAGPAGLSAAAELRRLGVANVLVLDREPEPGGIPRHCGHSPFGMREFHRILSGPTYAKRLAQTARAKGVRIETGVTVTGLHPDGELSVTSDQGPRILRASKVILAMGARETPRSTRFIGGTKPGGVVSTGALQSIGYLEGKRPFRAPVILGTELVAFSAILTCRHLGIHPQAMIEPGTRTTAAWPAGLLPRILGIPLHFGTRIMAINGKTHVTGVVLNDGHKEWLQDCDGVIVTGGFRPESALISASHLQRDPATGGPVVDVFGRCSDTTYFAAGNLLRAIETAGWCWSEGRSIAGSVAQALRKELPQSQGHRIAMRGDALKFVLPQRLGTGKVALDQLQIRFRTSAEGRLSLRVAGVETAGRDMTALPERRIVLPLPKDTKDVEVAFEVRP